MIGRLRRWFLRRTRPFRVSVEPLTVGRTLWFVCIDRPDRPLDAKPHEDGRVTPYHSPDRAKAEAEAAGWRAFLSL